MGWHQPVHIMPVLQQATHLHHGLAIPVPGMMICMLCCCCQGSGAAPQLRSGRHAGAAAAHERWCHVTPHDAQPHQLREDGLRVTRG
jgi:hypothetical protein